MALIHAANAFQLIQGVETLPLRMQKHVSNAQAVTEMLVANDAVWRGSNTPPPQPIPIEN